jgi:hypothetical protein
MEGERKRNPSPTRTAPASPARRPHRFPQSLGGSVGSLTGRTITWALVHRARSGPGAGAGAGREREWERGGSGWSDGSWTVASADSCGARTSRAGAGKDVREVRGFGGAQLRGRCCAANARGQESVAVVVADVVVFAVSAPAGQAQIIAAQATLGQVASWRDGTGSTASRGGAAASRAGAATSRAGAAAGGIGRIGATARSTGRIGPTASRRGAAAIPAAREGLGEGRGVRVRAVHRVVRRRVRRVRRAIGVHLLVIPFSEIGWVRSTAAAAAGREQSEDRERDADPGRVARNGTASLAHTASLARLDRVRQALALRSNRAPRHWR